MSAGDDFEPPEEGVPIVGSQNKTNSTARTKAKAIRIKWIWRNSRWCADIGSVSENKMKYLVHAGAWINSLVVPQANYFVTINLGHHHDFDITSSGGTVTGYVNRMILSALRSAAARRSIPFLWFGVIEVDDGLYHFHLMVHFPSKAILLKCLFPIWAKQTADISRTQEAFKNVVSKSRRGTCVHVSNISIKKGYRGALGAEGLVNYMLKNIDDTAKPQREKLIIQPLLMSQNINRLVLNSGMDQSGIWYDPREPQWLGDGREPTL